MPVIIYQQPRIIPETIYFVFNEPVLQVIEQVYASADLGLLFAIEIKICFECIEVIPGIQPG